METDGYDLSLLTEESEIKLIYKLIDFKEVITKISEIIAMILGVIGFLIESQQL